jgi:hypothetical protein
LISCPINRLTAGSVARNADRPHEQPNHLQNHGWGGEYKSQKYGYAEVPTRELIDWIDAYFKKEYGEDPDGDWGAGSLSFKPAYPKESVWPVIINPTGFQDGSHRLERYVKLGLEKIPVVFVA